MQVYKATAAGAIR